MFVSNKDVFCLSAASDGSNIGKLILPDDILNVMIKCSSTCFVRITFSLKLNH
jgi:hypothetical protein